MKHIKLFESDTHLKFIAVIHQGGGCDYTIECGTAVIELESGDRESAEIELSNIIEEEYTGERKLERASIYEITEKFDVDLNNVYRNISDNKKSIKDLEIEDRDKAEYDRLLKKFGHLRRKY